MIYDNIMDKFKFKVKEKVVTYCSIDKCDSPYQICISYDSIDNGNKKYYCKDHYQEVINIMKCKTKDCINTPKGSGHCDKCREEISNYYDAMNRLSRSIDNAKDDIKKIRDKLNQNYHDFCVYSYD